MLHHWRLQSQPRRRRRYWQLVRGGRAARSTVTLGFLSPTDARTALARANAPTDLERVHWLSRLGPGAAVAWLLDPDREILQDWLDASPDLSELTLREFAERHWGPMRDREVCAESRRREGSRVKPILAALGYRRLADLDTRAWHLFEQGRGHLSPRSRALERALYKSILDAAAAMGAPVQAHHFRPIRGSTQRSREVRPFTAEETRRLLAAAKGQTRALLALGVCVGLRPAELTAVRWEDLELESGVLRVRGTKNPQASAPVPVPEPALGHLQALWRERGQPRQGPVFVHPRHPDRPLKSLKSTLLAAARDAGVDRGRRVHPYLLRHSFSSLAASAGVHPAVIQRMLRHRSARTSLETYINLNIQQVAEGLRGLIPEPTCYRG